jgi:hypothetical protein
MEQHYQSSPEVSQINFQHFWLIFYKIAVKDHRADERRWLWGLIESEETVRPFQDDWIREAEEKQKKKEKIASAVWQ